VIRLLENNLQRKNISDFSELEQIGLAKSFELCFELLWKLLKDFLEFEGVETGLISPKNILKAAATSGLLQLIGADGDILMQAHKSRNELVHIYNHENFERTLVDVQKNFLPEMIKINNYFSAMVAENE